MSSKKRVKEEKKTTKKESIKRPSKTEKITASQQSTSITDSDDIPTNTFFARTYIFLLILFLLHFVFTVYVFFKVQRLETGGVQGVATTAANDVQPTVTPPILKPAKPSTNEPWRGPKDAQFVMIEFSDHECPFCREFHPSLKRVVKETGGVAWVFRHFALDFHPKAEPMALAVECAGEMAEAAYGEGTGYYSTGMNDAEDIGYWRLSDAIFEKMPEMEVTDIATVASEQGFDGTAIQTCVDEKRHADKVKADMDEVKKIGVGSTPTTVIYNMQTDDTLTIVGATTYESLKSQVDAFIKGSF